MKQTITYEVPDKYAGKTGWRKTRNRVIITLLLATVPLHAFWDCHIARKNKAKNPFWKECAARYLYLAVVARIN